MRAVAARATTSVPTAAAHVYAFYSWLLWPVLVRSALRQLTERRDWAKTEREPLETDPPLVPGAVPGVPRSAGPASDRPAHT